MSTLGNAILNTGLNATLNKLKSSSDPMSVISEIIAYNEKALSRNNPYEIEDARRKLEAVEVYLKSYPDLNGVSNSELKKSLNTVQARLKQVRSNSAKNIAKKTGSILGDTAGRYVATPTSMLRAIKVQNPMLGLLSDALGDQFKLFKAANDQSTKAVKQVSNNTSTSGDVTTNNVREASGADDATLLRIAETQDKQTEVLERLLAFTIDTWSAAGDSLEGILDKNTQSVERLREIDEDAKRARMERLEAARENDGPSAFVGPPAPVAPNQEEKGGILGNIFGALGLGALAGGGLLGRVGKIGRVFKKLSARNGFFSAVGKMGGILLRSTPGVMFALKGATGLLKLFGKGGLLSAVFAIFDTFDSDMQKQFFGKTDLDMGETLQFFFANLVGGFGDLFDGLTSILFGKDYDVGSKLREGVLGVFTAAQNSLTDAMVATVDTFTSVGDWFTEKYTTITTAIQSTYDGIVNKVSDFFMAIHNLVAKLNPANLWDNAVEGAKGLAQGAADGAVELAQGATDLAQGAANIAFDNAKNLFGINSSGERRDELKRQPDKQQQTTIVDASSRSISNTNTTVVAPAQLGVRNDERSAAYNRMMNYSPSFG